MDHREIGALIEKDSSLLFVVNEKPPGWKNMKCIVHIKRPGSEEKILRLLHIAHEHSPMRDADLRHRLLFIFQTSTIPYSLLKLFTGFATAALIA